jgi:hypothetical protein
MAIARQRFWLPIASAACLAMAVVCSESIHFRSFWPELLTVASLGLLLTSLLRDVQYTLAQLERDSDRFA